MKDNDCIEEKLRTLFDKWDKPQTLTDFERVAEEAIQNTDLVWEYTQANNRGYDTGVHSLSIHKSARIDDLAGWEMFVAKMGEYSVSIFRSNYLKDCNKPKQIPKRKDLMSRILSLIRKSKLCEENKATEEYCVVLRKGNYYENSKEINCWYEYTFGDFNEVAPSLKSTKAKDLYTKLKQGAVFYAKLRPAVATDSTIVDEGLK